MNIKGAEYIDDWADSFRSSKMQLPCLWKSRILSKAGEKIEHSHMGKHTASMMNRISNLLARRQNLVLLYTCFLFLLIPRAHRKLPGSYWLSCWANTSSDWCIIRGERYIRLNGCQEKVASAGCLGELLNEHKKSTSWMQILLFLKPVLFSSKCKNKPSPRLSVASWLELLALQCIDSSTRCYCNVCINFGLHLRVTNIPVNWIRW